jgi:MazG family protein
VFGDAVADDPDAVLSQWEKIKASEKDESSPVASSTPEDSILKKANDGLPALMAAQKLQKKVAKVGFDWPEPAPVLEKIREEVGETAEAMQSGSAEAVAEEIGDLLFAVVNLARKTGNDAELLLHQANRKFVSRFQEVERQLAGSGTSLEAADLRQMDEAWEAAKSKS